MCLNECLSDNDVTLTFFYVMFSPCVYKFSGSPLSMAIHRVGETLLIDEFAAPMAPPTGVSEADPVIIISCRWLADC